MQKKSVPRHVILILSQVEDKKKKFKDNRRKRTETYKGTPIRLSADFSAETLQARSEWKDILKVLKQKHYRLRILYSAKLSSRQEEAKTFPEKQKPKFINTRPVP